MIGSGRLMAVVGQTMCWAAPPDLPGRKFALGSVAAVGIFLVAGFLAVATPLSELRRIFGLGGFGELSVLPLLLLGLAAVSSYLMFALFLPGLALFYQNVTLAKSV